MSKQLHAVGFDGITFGMEIEATTAAYRNFKKAIKYEKCVSSVGSEIYRNVVPYLALGAIMGKAYWLVTENKGFDKIRIDNFPVGEIYVKYTDEPIDFRIRKSQINHHTHEA